MKTITSIYLLAAFLTIYFAAVSSKGMIQCYDCIEGADETLLAKLKNIKHPITQCDKGNISLSLTDFIDNDSEEDSKFPACFTIHANLTMNSTLTIRLGYAHHSNCRHVTSKLEENMGKFISYECEECYKDLCNSKRPPEPCKECKSCSSSKATKIELKYFHIIYFAIFYGLYQYNSFLKSPY